MSSLEKQKGKVYWRSLADLADEPEVRKHLERAFPQSELGEPGSVSRRRFMQLMGASVALATGSACRWEKENILPFTRRPAGTLPGLPQHYATTMELGGHGLGLLVTSHEGRPTKIEGNPQHPTSLGGTDAFAQASILELYDPDRSRNPTTAGQGQERVPSGWVDFLNAVRPIISAARGAGGRGLRVLSEATSSPTAIRLRDRLLATLPEARWYEYEPVSRDNERLGTTLVFGAPQRTHLDLDRARIILSLDDDFLHMHPQAVRHARDFAAHRRAGKTEMNRLYVVESRHSNTGAMADHRLPLRSEQIGPFLLALTAEVLSQPGITVPADVAGYKTPSKEDASSKLLRALAKDLVAHQGKSVVTVGIGQPPEVHALAQQLNVILGNAGVTVQYTPEPDPARQSHADAIKELTADLNRGTVSTLLVLGGNPVFNAPAELNFAEAISKAQTSIHLSLYQDETSARTTWHVPRAHYLESWGDARSYDGTVSLLQPLIEPLYNGKTPAELIALFAGDEGAKPRDLVHQTVVDLGGAAEGEKKWHQTVRDGFLVGSAWQPVTPTRRPLPLPSLPATSAVVDNGNLELTFWPDSHVYDGRFANNGWLQELPDFMSKITWDNAALFAPETAKALGVGHQTKVKLKVNGREVEVAAFVLPGQAAGSVAVFLGYGRTAAGHIGGSTALGVPSAGFDTYAIRQTTPGNFVTGLQVEATGKFFELAVTQNHHELDALAEKGRGERLGEIVREATLEEFEREPEFAKEVVEHPPLKSLWTEEFNYDHVYRWGLSIDMGACVGCNACVVACQAENNVPIVGREQVIRHREMHWLRIDRYFSGDPAAPSVVHMPMLCQQCENAPCESVCPVAATSHSQEGLNDMVYNRCIGTRYCSNNCPYKVRRFNFLNFHKDLEDPQNRVQKMVYNPDVTVRARGVMEKCTYCVQRIQTVKIAAKNEKRKIEDGEITTACAQACPANAIYFGDLNNGQSAVAREHADPRSYFVLEELNTKPRTAYLARVTNPNPELS